MEQSTQQDSSKPTFESVWLMFQEVSKKYLETDKKFKETDEMFKETDKKFKETDEKFKETKELLEKSAQEFDIRQKETNRILKNLMTKSSEYDDRWGKFVESLVEGRLIEMLNEWEIPVTGSSKRENNLYNGKQYEFDIIAKNGKDFVAVEVKTTLKVRDVNKFIETLKIFKQIFPDYAKKDLRGCVAFIHDYDDAARYAAKKGLLVIRAVGASAKIINSGKFKPKIW